MNRNTGCNPPPDSTEDLTSQRSRLEQQLLNIPAGLLSSETPATSRPDVLVIPPSLRRLGRPQNGSDEGAARDSNANDATGPDGSGNGGSSSTKKRNSVDVIRGLVEKAIEVVSEGPPLAEERNSQDSASSSLPPTSQNTEQPPQPDRKK